jgi:hypothetical protein
MKACLHGAYAGDQGEDKEDKEGAAHRAAKLELASAVFGRTRRRAAKEGTAAQLLAPDAVGLTAIDDDELLLPRSKVRRTFVRRKRGIQRHPPSDSLPIPFQSINQSITFIKQKDELRRIFFQRLGPQCGLASEEAFERVFSRALAREGHHRHQGGGGAGGGRCSIQAFHAALEEGNC